MGLVPPRHPRDDLAARLGERLRVARVARGMSQAQVGAPYYGRQAVSAIELGHTLPSLATLQHLARRLGVSMRDLLPPGA